jgi:hypothetical protein
VPVALGDPGVTRAVIGAGLYLTVLGLLALAIAAYLLEHRDAEAAQREAGTHGPTPPMRSTE